MAAVSLFVSLGGISYAAVQINSTRQIANGVIQSADLANNAVTSATIGKGQVKAGDIAPNQVTADKIANGAVSTTDLARASLTGANIAADTVTGANVDESSLGPVPQAAKADRAGEAERAKQAEGAERAQTAGNADTVNGLGVRTFRLEGNATNAATERILLDNLGGMRLTGDCVSDDVDFFVINVSGESATLVHSQSAPGQPDSHFAGPMPPGGGEQLSASPYDDNTTGVLTFKTASTVVTATYSMNEDASEPRCSITGTVVGG